METSCSLPYCRFCRDNKFSEMIALATTCAVLYDYRITRAGESGWWRHERRGLSCPPISLNESAK